MRFIESMFIIYSLLSLIKSLCTPDDEELLYLDKIRRYKHCERRLTDEEINDNMYKCCYLYYFVDTRNVKSEVNTCIPITRNEYDNIRDTVRNYERKNDVEDVIIRCKGFYFNLGFLGIMLYLLY